MESIKDSIWRKKSSVQGTQFSDRDEGERERENLVSLKNGKNNKEFSHQKRWSENFHTAWQLVNS